MYTSIKINNYKCFTADSEPQGFDIIKPINVIIGKNNSGKSKLLEALGEIVTKKPESLSFNGFLYRPLEQEELFQIFPDTLDASIVTHRWTGGSSAWDEVGMYLVGAPALFVLQQHEFKFREAYPQKNNLDWKRDIIGQKLQETCNLNVFNDYRFLHLQAERDINQEPIDYNTQISISSIRSNATGICGLISRMLNDANGNNEGWQEYIEKDFLKLINLVVFPEIKFTRIYTKTSQSNLYEIYLEEEHKGGIKLSDCGSGLKTIIATLTLLHIVPHLTGNYKNVFALEELENNLHPSLERKLLKHIREYSVKYPDALIFLTTHSNVALDMFGKDYRSQIVRVCNDGHRSTVETVLSDNDKQILLDDLGVKASDLLQANCIIWVEGPSDRIYIKKWLDLFSDGKLEEGLQYQFICYGGALLSHYTINTNKDLIDLLKINRHSYVIMDSDKDSDDTELKTRVAKIAKQMPNNHWITDGKEIENYLPAEALSDYFGKAVNIKKNCSFANLYKNTKSIKSFDKVAFAAEITKSKNYTKENLCKCLDLEQKVKELIAFIEKSNSSEC